MRIFDKRMQIALTAAMFGKIRFSCPMVFKFSTLILPCSVQNFETIGLLRNKLRVNKFSRDLGLRYVFRTDILYCTTIPNCCCYIKKCIFVPALVQSGLDMNVPISSNLAGGNSFEIETCNVILC